MASLLLVEGGDALLLTEGGDALLLVEVVEDALLLTEGGDALLLVEGGDALLLTEAAAELGSVATASGTATVEAVADVGLAVGSATGIAAVAAFSVAEAAASGASTAAAQASSEAASSGTSTAAGLLYPLRAPAAARPAIVSAGMRNWSVFSSTSGLQALVAQQYNGLTPGNAFKWVNTEPSQGTFSFTEADQFVSWADAAGLVSKLHVLVWHNSLPAWVAPAVNAGTWQGIIDAHIAGVLGHYPGRVWDVDVVNEAFRTTDGQPGGFRNNLWYQAAGPDYVPYSFERARANSATARLLLAEFAIEQSGQDDRRAALLAAVEDWIGQGVPIDGIAIQSHLQPAIALDKAALREFLRALRGLGLDIVISEFDFREISALALGDTAAFAAIKAYAVEYLGLVLGEGADTVVTWGVSPEDWAATGTEQVAAVPFGAAPEHTTTTLYDALIQELESRYARADGVATAESLSEAGLATGSAAGTSTVAALGEADFAAAAAAVGTSTVAALSEVDFAAAAAATGASTVAAQASSAAAASGTSTADALADAVAATVGSAAGTATVAAQTSSEALAAGSATVVGSSDPGRATGASDASALVGAVGVAYVDAAGVSTNTVLANAVGAPLVDAEVVAAGSSAATAGSMSEASAAGAATAAAQPASTAAASGAATVLSIGDFGSVGSSAGTSTAVGPSTIFATADAAASGAATVIGWGATGPLYADDLSGHSGLDVDLYGMAA